MIALHESVKAWPAADFRAVLKREVERLDPVQLPLQQGLARSSYVTDDPFEVMVIGAEDAGGAIHARLGIFYSGIIAGCSCADDPTPIEAQSEYCEVQLSIDKATAQTTVALLLE